MTLYTDYIMKARISHSHVVSLSRTRNYYAKQCIIVEKSFLLIFKSYFRDSSTKISILNTHVPYSSFSNSVLYIYVNTILKDPGAVTRVDKLLFLKVYCKIETSSSTFKQNAFFCKKEIYARNHTFLSLKNFLIIRVRIHLCYRHINCWHGTTTLRILRKHVLQLEICVLLSSVVKYIYKTYVLY